MTTARPEATPGVRDRFVRRGFRPDIEGLRAVAVLLVVLHHAGLPLLPGGYVGVDVFFVISGFLITSNLVDELRSTGTISWPAFVARRARRLLPLAAVVALGTVVATWVLAGPLRAREVSGDAVWAALFSLNVHLGLEGVDYGGVEAPSPLQHYWSLGVEEQFYLVWPLLLLLASGALLRRRSRGGDGTRRPHLAPVAVVLAIVAAASFAWSLQQTAVAQPIAYFLTPARAWELAVGAGIALAAPLLTRMPRNVGAVLSAGGVLAVVDAAVRFDETTPFPGTAALLPVLGAAAAVTGGIGGATAAERLLGNRAMCGIGRLSYGWYLWHWPMLVLAPYLLGGELGLLAALGVSVLSLWCAACSFIAFEEPLRTLPVLVGSARPAIAMGVGLTAVVVAVSTALSLFGPTVRAQGAEAATVAPELGALQQAVATATEPAEAPGNLEPQVEEAADDLPTSDNADGISCMVDFETTDVSAEPGGSCAYGDVTSDVTVVLFGDSHAYAWFPAMEQIATDNSWRLVNLTKSACTPYDVYVYNQTLGRDYTECEAWRQNAIQRITEEQPELVVTVGAVFSERDPGYTAAWEQGVGTTVGALRETGAQVVSLQDTPFPSRDVPSCVADNLDDVSACAVPRAEAYSDAARRDGTAAAAARAGASVVDPVPWLCTDTLCPVVVGNQIVYHDDSHLTATFSRSLAPILASALPAVTPRE